MQNLKGKVFGHLTVISEPIRLKKKIHYLVKCVCGNEKQMFRESIIRPSLNKNCGKCMRNLNSITHGKSKTPEFRAWWHFIDRCENPNDKAYHLYGGRGIRVCNRYREAFQNFWDDLGQKPSRKHSIDRIDNDLNYSCGKCDDCKNNGWEMNLKWHTQLEQMRNTRMNVWYEYEGEKLIVTDWARKLNINPVVFGKYIRKHKSIEKAIKHYTTPNKNGRRLLEHNGESHTIADWARKLNVEIKTFWSYLNRHSIGDTVLHYSK